MKQHKLIGVEEHFTTIEHLDNLRAIYDKTYPVRKVIDEETCILSDAPFVRNLEQNKMIDKLLNTGDGRLQEMDQCGIDMQVLSFVAPGVQIFDAEAAVNLTMESLYNSTAGLYSATPWHNSVVTMIPKDDAGNDLAQVTVRPVQDVAAIAGQPLQPHEFTPPAGSGVH